MIYVPTLFSEGEKIIILDFFLSHISITGVQTGVKC